MYWALRDHIVNKRYGFPTSVHIGKSVFIAGDVRIGENSSIASHSHLVAGRESKVVIGKNCAISYRVTLRAKARYPHKSPKDPSRIEEDIIVGDGVWIGANVFVKHKIRIGDNSVVGANSVVTKDIEPSTIVGGVPARLIRKIERDSKSNDVKTDLLFLKHLEQERLRVRLD